MYNIDLTKKSETWKLKKDKKKQTIKTTKHKKLWSYIQMGKEILTFDDIDIEKEKF